MTGHDPRLTLLDGIALELARKAGFDAAVRLMVNFGGQRLYVPKKIRARRPTPKRYINDTDFVGLLGSEAANALVQIAGGEHIEVPLGKALHSHQRRAQVAHFKGTNNEAVKAFRLHRRTIQRLRCRQTDDGQRSLL